MNDLTLPLLGVLSSTEIVQDNSLEQELNKVRKSIVNSLIPAIRKSSYVAKSRLERSLERCINDAATLCVLPWFLGHSCIGIVGEGTAIQPVLASLGQGLDILSKRPSTIPSLIFNEKDNPRIQALSLAGKIVNLKDLENHPQESPEVLTQEEYETLLELNTDGINPRDILSALLYFVPCHFAASSYLILPPDEFGRQGSGKLIAQCNTMFICGNIENQTAIEILCNDFNMPVYILSDNESVVQCMAEKLKNRYAGRQVEIIGNACINELLNKLNFYVERSTLHDRLLSEVLQVEESLSNKIKRYKVLNELFHHDNILLNIKDNILNELIEKFQQGLNRHIENIHIEKKQFNETYKSILNEASLLDDKLRRISNNSCSTLHVHIHAGVMRPESLWRRIVLRALVSGHMDIVEKYQVRLQASFPEHAFLTELYIHKSTAQTISQRDIEKLRNMPDSPEVLRAKIYFRKELRLTEQDCVNISALLPRAKDEAEKYYWAVHLYDVYQADKNSDKSDKLPFDAVINAFRGAILAGSDDAAERFAKFCAGEKRLYEVREIADMGNPTAAYIYRLLALTTRKYKDADRYLKIAAALGYSKAINLIAEKCWKKRIQGKNVTFNYGEGWISGLDSNLVNAGISLYEYLNNHPELASETSHHQERLGYFYFADRQWRKCRDTLGAFPQTTEGKFCLAVMLKYGHGGRMRKNDAIKLMRQAENGNGPFANLSRNIKLQWYKDDLASIE